jgi:hypothetical protein
MTYTDLLGTGGFLILGLFFIIFAMILNPVLEREGRKGSLAKFG